MKRVINASIAYDTAERKARKILAASKNLLDLLEDTPSGFLDNNDLGSLYEELIETIPALDLAIKSKGLDIDVIGGPHR